MKVKCQLLFILLTIVIVSFPSICFSEMKTITSECCGVYLGDLKNKKKFKIFKDNIKRSSMYKGIFKVYNNDEPLYTSCVNHIINNYVDKIIFDTQKRNGRKICQKVKITFDNEVIEHYIKTERKNCIIEAPEPVFPPELFWIDDVRYFFKHQYKKQKDKMTIGILVDVNIKKIDNYKKEEIQNQEEEDIHIALNSEDIKFIERRHLDKVLQEQILSSSGITENEPVKLGKILNLEIIILRMIYENSKVTKVLKVDTGEVLFFKTY